MHATKSSKMQEQFLYLTTRGWKSGNSHRIEIWFAGHEGSYYIVSEMREHSHWVQNIRHDSSVTFRVGKKTFTGSARTLDKKVEPALFAAVKKLMESKYKWGDGLIVELTPVTAREPSG